MSDSSVPLFADIDPSTGQHRSTSYASIRESLLSDISLTDDLPEDIRQLALIAVDYITLAYEQMNQNIRPRA